MLVTFFKGSSLITYGILGHPRLQKLFKYYQSDIITVRYLQIQITNWMKLNLQKSHKPDKQQSTHPELESRKTKQTKRIGTKPNHQLGTDQSQKNLLLRSPKGLNSAISSQRNLLQQQTFKKPNKQIKNSALVCRNPVNGKLAKAKVPAKREGNQISSGRKGENVKPGGSKVRNKGNKEDSGHPRLNSQKSQMNNFSLLQIQSQGEESLHQTSQLPSSSILNQVCMLKSSQARDQEIQTEQDQSEKIQDLRKQNDQLRRKFEKIKQSQQQNRKKLRSRINTFNEQGEELRTLKQKVLQLQTSLQRKEAQTNNQSESQKQTLQKCRNFVYESVLSIRVQSSPQQRSFLKEQKVQQVENKEKSKKSDDQIVEGVQLNEVGLSLQDHSKLQSQTLSLGNREGSSINDSVYQFQGEFLQLTETFRHQISNIKIAYESKYHKILEEITHLHKQQLQSVGKRYQTFFNQQNQTLREQQQEIIALQNNIDQLYIKAEVCTCSKKVPRLDPNLNQQHLYTRIQLDSCKKTLAQRDSKIRQSKQLIIQKEFQLKKALAELDLQRIKLSFFSQHQEKEAELKSTAEQEATKSLEGQLKIQKQLSEKLLISHQQKEEIIRKLTQALQKSQKVSSQKVKK